jgi:hypothetical protein
MNLHYLMTSRRKGSALALALLAVIVLFIMGGALLALGLNSRVYSIRTSSDIAARCAADAGLTKAVALLNQRLEKGVLTKDSLPSAEGQLLEGTTDLYSYAIVQDANGNYAVQATGVSADRHRTVQSLLRLKGPWDYAIFTKDNITLNNGASVKGYNLAKDDVLKMGTTGIGKGQIQLKLGSSIDGDVLVGVGGDPAVVIRDYGTTITGDTYAMKAAPTLDYPTVPTWLSSSPSKGNITSATTITTSGKYGKIDVGNGNIVTIDGQVTLFVTDGITLDNSAQLKVVSTNPKASLTIYLGGDLICQNGGSINNETAKPNKMKIFGLSGCTQMIFKNSTTLYASVYGPNANILFDNSADAYGAVVGKNFQQKNSAAFYYDGSLKNITKDDELVSFTISRWTE